VEVRVLGPVEALDDEGRTIELGGRKQRSVFALLALSPNQVVSVDRLVDEVWGDETPSKPLGTLQVYVHNLRKLLEPVRPTGTAPEVLITRRPGYMLRCAPDKHDLSCFATQVDAARVAAEQSAHDEVSRTLRAALELWRGDALADLVFEPWAQREVTRLEELRAATLELLLDSELALGRHDRLVGELESLVRKYPLRERFSELLMLALYRCGRQASALEVYQRARLQLIEDLGIDPGPTLQRLEQAVLDHDPALDLPQVAPVDARVPPIGESAQSQRNIRPLPTPLRASLIGRAAEVAELVGMLDEHPVVTVTGAAGCGKTRVALEAGRERHPDDGVVAVDCSDLVAGHALASAVATALGLGDDFADVDAIVRAICPHDIVIVLDHCEHLREEVSPFVAAFRDRESSARVVVTTREPLNDSGEYVLLVPPLGTPTGDDLSPEELMQFDAVKLFTDRARAAISSFTLSQDNADAVAQIVRRLDGLPLALELAAARVRALSPSELAARLEERFRILTGGRGAATQTLRAAIDWSYDLLSDAERDSLQQLSVFVGPASLDAIEAVVRPANGDALNLLFQLVDRSLVVVERIGGSVRYRLLETIREYGRERAGERGGVAAARLRHAQWFRDAAEASRHLFLTDVAVNAFELDVENHRAALQWWLETRDTTSALIHASALSTFWLRRGRLHEGRRFLERALALSGDLAPGLRARAEVAAAALALELGDDELARTRAESAQDDCVGPGDERTRAYAIALLGALARRAGDVHRARDLATEAVDVFRTLDDGIGTASALRELGLLSSVEGDHVLAQSLLEEGLAQIDAALGRASNSRPFDPGLAHRGRSQLLGDLGKEAGAGGDPQRGLRLVADSLAVAHTAANRLGVLRGVEVLAVVVAQAGDDEHAAMLLGRIERLREEMGAGAGIDDVELRHLRTAIRARLGEEQARSAEQRGRSLDDDQTVRLATRLAVDVAQIGLQQE
jgi:predicted ATPase/DNA-binding SARP family transcriptional activator